MQGVDAYDADGTLVPSGPSIFFPSSSDRNYEHFLKTIQEKVNFLRYDYGSEISSICVRDMEKCLSKFVRLKEPETQFSIFRRRTATRVRGTSEGRCD